METTNKSKNRKKSGAENRKASKSRREENERLGSFMKSYFTKSSKSCEDDASSIDQEPLNVAGDKNKENTSSDKPYDMDDDNNVELENEVKVVQDLANFTEFDSECKVGQGKVQDNEIEVEESAGSGVETSASEFDSDSSADCGDIYEFNKSKFYDGFTDFETGHQVPNEALHAPIPHQSEENTAIIEHHMVQRNPAILNEAGNETNDPALLVGMKFSIEEKEKLCKNEPCQPPESVLSERKKNWRS